MVPMTTGIPFSRKCLIHRMVDSGREKSITTSGFPLSESVTGTLPYVNPLHSASDIRNPILFSGIPTVGLGPLAGDLAHNRAHDEWVDAADFIRAVKITATIMLEWGKTGRARRPPRLR